MEKDGKANYRRGLDSVYGLTQQFNPDSPTYLNDSHFLFVAELEKAHSRDDIRKCAYFEGLERWRRTISLSMRSDIDHIETLFEKELIWAPDQLEKTNSLSEKAEKMVSFVEHLDQLLCNHKSRFIYICKRHDEVWHSDRFLDDPIFPDESHGTRTIRLAMQGDRFNNEYQKLTGAHIGEAIHRFASSLQ